MKFVVTRPYHGSEVEVKLHWETKEKIKRVLYFTSLSCFTAVAVIVHRNNRSTTHTE